LHSLNLGSFNKFAMKTRTLVIVCAVAVAGVLLGWGVHSFANHKDYDGLALTREVPVADFSVLDVSVPCDVTYVQDGGSPKVSISASEKLLSEIEIRSEGGRVGIGFKNNRMCDRLGEISITVNSSSLEKLNLSGSVDFESKSINTSGFAASLAGRNDVEIDHLATESLTVSMSGSADFDADGSFGETKVSISGSGGVTLGGEFGDVSLSIAGSGDVKLSGKAGDVKASIAGSGDIDLSRLSCGKVSSHVSGSGNIIQ